MRFPPLHLSGGAVDDSPGGLHSGNDNPSLAHPNTPPSEDYTTKSPSGAWMESEQDCCVDTVLGA